jgi:archaellum component FlaC
MQFPDIVNNMAYKFLLPLLLAVAALPAHAKLYKWVDAQGNVHYTDTLPPDSAGQGNSEVKKSGSVVKRAESTEEKEKRLAAEKEAAVAKKAAAERARKDRALLATYTSEQEIDLSRDRALEHHNLAIKSAEARLKQLEPRVKDITKKVEAASKGGKPVPAYLKQQYDSALSEVEDAKASISMNQEAMVAVRERYETDKLRFRELTAKP